jgi:hypothetical protein
MSKPLIFALKFGNIWNIYDLVIIGLSLNSFKISLGIRMEKFSVLVVTFECWQVCEQRFWKSSTFSPHGFCLWHAQPWQYRGEHGQEVSECSLIYSYFKALKCIFSVVFNNSHPPFCFWFLLKSGQYIVFWLALSSDCELWHWFVIVAPCEQDCQISVW